jgi:peptidoglycan/xylan/chitin deacetylase (PgdA/CDA1 family)
MRVSLRVPGVPYVRNLVRSRLDSRIFERDRDAFRAKRERGRNTGSVKKSFTIRAPRLKRAVLSTVFETLRSTGALSLVGKTGRRNRSLAILCYHGVSLGDEHLWRPDLYISPELLAKRLKCLRDANVNVLPFDEAITRLQGGSLPPKSVAITFDDGFHDFYHSAAPILAQFSYPATVYLTTHYVEYPLPVYNLMLDYLLWKAKCHTVSLPEYGIVRPMLVADAAGRQSAVQEVDKWIEDHHLDTSGRDDILRNIAHRFGIDYNSILQTRLLQLMSPSEVQKMARSGISIELHTHRHRTPADRSSFIKEIKENQYRIRELSGREPVHFCYPSGRYSATFARWLSECGIQSAATCRPGMASASSNPMMLPRMLDDSLQAESRFYGVLNGVVI